MYRRLPSELEHSLFDVPRHVVGAKWSQTGITADRRGPFRGEIAHLDYG